MREKTISSFVLAAFTGHKYLPVLLHAGYECRAIFRNPDTAGIRTYVLCLQGE